MPLRNNHHEDEAFVDEIRVLWKGVGKGGQVCSLLFFHQMRTHLTLSVSCDVDPKRLNISPLHLLRARIHTVIGIVEQGSGRNAEIY